MANYMTSADIIKCNNSEALVGVIDECIAEGGVPEIGWYQASPVTKNTYKTLCVTGLPTVNFRDPESDRVFSSASIANKTTALRYIDMSFIIPCAVADECDFGREFAISLQQAASIKAGLFKICQQLYYGSYSAGTDEGFNGLLPFIKTANCAVVDTGNTGITDSTDVLLVTTGLNACQLAWGSQGKLYESDVYEQLIASTDSTTGNKSGAYYFTQNIGGWVGLQITSKWAAGAITNLSGTAGKEGLDDDKLAALISKFPVGALNSNSAFFMNRRSLEQLRKSRTATNGTGAPAPFPTEAFGYRIICTEALANDGVVA